MSDEELATFVTQFADYMADPKIDIKYFTLVNNMLMTEIPLLEGRKIAFNLTCKKIVNLASECYDLKKYGDATPITIPSQFLDTLRSEAEALKENMIMTRNPKTFDIEQVYLKDIEGGMPSLLQMKNFEQDKEKLADALEQSLEGGDALCRAFSLY